MSENSFRGRTLARSQAVQLLYQAEFTDRSVDQVLAGVFVLSGAAPGEYTITRVTPGMARAKDDPDDGKVWVWEQKGNRRMLPRAADGSFQGYEEAPGEYVRVRLRSGDDKGLLDVRGHNYRILVWDDSRDAYVTALLRKEDSLALDIDETGCTVWDEHSGRYLINDYEGIIDPYALELSRGASDQLECLDEILNQNSPNWGVSRMPALDRNLLRIALYEMLFEDDISDAVAIDECVELSKSYGTDDSSRFINGVLGTISRLDKEPEVLLGEAREAVERRHEEERIRREEEERLRKEEEERIRLEEERRAAEEAAYAERDYYDGPSGQSEYAPAPESALFEPFGGHGDDGWHEPVEPVADDAESPSDPVEDASSGDGFESGEDW